MRYSLCLLHGCRRNGEQGPSGPWFFGSTKACYARRQNSRKVVSGNEPATGCCRLYQRAHARRSPNGFCNAGVHLGRTEIAEGVAGTAQLAFTRYNTSLVIHPVDPRSKFRQRRQLLGPAYESMNHPG